MSVQVFIFSPQSTQSYAKLIILFYCLYLTERLSIWLGRNVFTPDSGFTWRNLASFAVNKG